MTDGNGDRDPGIWREARRRRVWKVVAAYLAIGFAGFEAVELLRPNQGSTLFGRVVLGALVLGFPAAVVLAWRYDVTPAGVVRTPDHFGTEEPAELTGRLWIVLTVAGFVAGSILRMLRG